MSRYRHADPEQVYFDLLPLTSRSFLDSGVTVQTPCRPAPRLGEAIGVPGLWLKDESRQPTRTTKDRLASVVTAVLRQFGVKEFVGSSTGNSSTALARAVRMDPTMRAHFFCGAEFVANHDIPYNSRTKLTVVQGSYVDASAEARIFAAAQGLHFDAGFFNWARREGLKLAYLEALDAMDRTPDVVVQAVSSGMGMLAAHKGMREYLEIGELDRMPRFLMAQEESCAPAAKGWRNGRAELSDADRIEHPTGLATAILLGDGSPYYPYLHSIAAGTGGSIVSAAREDLITARRMLHTIEGIDVCYASAAAIAALRNEASAGRIRPDETVLVNLTGRSRMTADL
ncbi:pyridoxal-phosphate dependent enzyme [Streptomyces coacervatus]|uniref:threonine synthase n=1 Tax=Streptomyces coacervatus TaxID=647381 RepID=UPI0023DC1FA7|nr:pyridoxal-phosphate dependent enzyme [Streptomyces coacervatus]MDF2273528.1 pyridoxal-phosphate dependent enzyme [Streptomyces coacervatus]